MVGFCGFGQIVDIPDEIFKHRLVNSSNIAWDLNDQPIIVDSNGDGEIQVSEAEAISRLWVSGITGAEIQDLTGIEYFTNLQKLECDENQISELDVSQNLNLTLLYCHDNQLNDLDLSDNLRLYNVAFGGNNITDIDLSNNTNLSVVDCSDSPIIELNLTNNPLVDELYCNASELQRLYIKNGNNENIINGYFDIGDIPNLQLLCVDEEFIDNFQSIVDDLGYSGCNVTSTCNLSNNEVKMKSKNSLYPNPVTSELNIKAESKIKSVQIFDMNGKAISKILFTGNQNQITLNVEKLPQSIYLVKTETYEGISVEKILKK